MQSLPPPGMPSVVAAKQSLEIFISCRKLKNLDTFSKSDPIAFLKMKEPSGSSWIQIGKTQVKMNTINPDFSTSFIIDYYFERTQNIRIDVYDKDEGSKLDYIGSTETVVGKIAGARKQTFITDLMDSGNKKAGTLILRAQAVKSSNDVIFFDVQALKIDDVDGMFSKSDGFLVFQRAREATGDGSLEFVRTYQTEVIKNNLSPHWKPFQVKYQTLCNSDPYIPINIQLWDWEKSGKHKFIGQISKTNMNSILGLHGGGELEFINQQKKAKKKKYQNSGRLRFDVAKIVHRPSFVQYLRSGWAITLSVAIDFTGSNGNPQSPGSLHYLGGMAQGALNQYEQAIWQVGQILQNYDYDKKFPVVGFGGVPSFLKAASTLHCFPLTHDGSEVFGTQGILDAYRYAINNTALSGPTLFSGILDNCQAVVQSCKGIAMYHVLLILTDGQINDMDGAKERIVRMSKLPVSIIIVGIGSADFSGMQELDSDKKVLSDFKGNKAERDIVQFVQFNEFKGNGQLLADSVLKQVPKQLVGFMQANNIETNIQGHQEF